MCIFGKKIDKSKEKIFILIVLILFFLLIKLSILFFGFDKIYEFGELQYGACARELISSHNLPFSSYYYIGSSVYKGNNSGALTSLMNILVVPFFLLFGESHLTLKLVHLSINLVTLVFLYLFLYKFFSKKIAVIASILFINGPSIATKFSLMGLGNQYETILFTILAMHIFYKIFFNNNDQSINFILFGLISALGLCLNYIFLITLTTCLLLWFIFDYRFFIRRQFLIFIVTFIVCLIPWAYYIIYKIGGVYIYSKPIYQHFLGNGAINSLIRLKDLVSTHLFNLFLLEDIGFIKGRVLSSIYYLVAVLSLCALFWQNTKYLLKLLFKNPYRKPVQISSQSVPKELFIFIYLIIFFIVCSFSDFSIGGWNSNLNFMNYRYLGSLYLFLFITIALFLDKLSFKKYMRIISNSIIIFLILVSLLSNLAFISYNKFNGGLTREGFCYLELGSRFALRFKEETNIAINLMDKVDKDNRELMYQGFTVGLTIGLIADNKLNYDNMSEYINIVNQDIDKMHYTACYEGLGIGFMQLVWEGKGRVAEGINLIKQLDQKYQGYFYRGLGIGMCMQDVFGLDSAEYLDWMMNNIDQRYLDFFYRGAGTTLGLYLGRKITNCINKINQFNTNYRRFCYYGLGETYGMRANYSNVIIYINNINQIDKDYRNYSYQGLGRGISFRYGYDINKCIAMIEKVNEEYKPDCYYGAGQGAGTKYGYDINKCKEILSQIDKKYKDNFSRGLKDGIGQFWVMGE